MIPQNLQAVEKGYPKIVTAIKNFNQVSEFDKNQCPKELFF